MGLEFILEMVKKINLS